MSAYAEAWVGIGCLRRPTRVRFYAVFSWICLRAHSLSNIFVWLRTLLRSCSWSNDRIKNNEEEEGHVLIHWLLHCFLAAGKQHIMLQGHVWGNPWSWEFSPTRCLLFASAVPTRGNSFIFGFWPCKLRDLRLCRKGNGIVPWAVVSQQNSCYLLITCVFWTAEISHAASSYTH